MGEDELEQSWERVFKRINELTASENKLLVEVEGLRSLLRRKRAKVRDQECATGDLELRIRVLVRACSEETTLDAVGRVLKERDQLKKELERATASLSALTDVANTAAMERDEALGCNDATVRKVDAVVNSIELEIGVNASGLEGAVGELVRSHREAWERSSRLAFMHSQMVETLTHAQARCTAMEQELRELRRSGSGQ